MKTIMLDGDDVGGRDADYIAELIAEALQARGIEFFAFSWCIEVDYEGGEVDISEGLK